MVRQRSTDSDLDSSPICWRVAGMRKRLNECREREGQEFALAILSS